MHRKIQEQILKTFFFLAAFFALPHFASAADKLLQQSDLTYLGAFRVPYSSDYGNSFHGGGTALTFNPSGNGGSGSLFMANDIVWGGKIGEITIPALKSTADFHNLNTASFLNYAPYFYDITEGNSTNLHADGTAITQASIYLGGLMLYDNKLIGNEVTYYEKDTEQVRSHFTHSADLATSSFSGMFTLGSGAGGAARFFSGYMTNIPAEYQAALGGKALTGQSAETISVDAALSWGPCAFSFNPDDLGVANPVLIKPLVNYPYPAHTIMGQIDNPATNQDFNGSTKIRAVVFPDNTKSILFFGRQGKGAYCYGTGTNNQSLEGQPVGDGSTYCFDPTDTSKGMHAYPYKYEVWAYDVDDLIHVKNGDIISAGRGVNIDSSCATGTTYQPWCVKPYATWTLDNIPYDSEYRYIYGASYDASTQRLFVSQGMIDGTYADEPIIHVFHVDLGATETIPPAAPSGLNVT